MYGNFFQSCQKFFIHFLAVNSFCIPLHERMLKVQQIQLHTTKHNQPLMSLMFIEKVSNVEKAGIFTFISILAHNIN